MTQVMILPIAENLATTTFWCWRSGQRGVSKHLSHIRLPGLDGIAGERKMIVQWLLCLGPQDLIFVVQVQPLGWKVLGKDATTRLRYVQNRKLLNVFNGHWRIGRGFPARSRTVCTVLQMNC